MATRDRMLYARQLIKARQYDDARRVLKTVKHPKAKEWLRKLPSPPPRKSRRAIIAVVAMVVIVIGVYSVSLFFEVKDNEYIAAIGANLSVYCYDVTAYAGVETDCGSWAQSQADNIQAQACYNLYPDLESPLQDCLIRENILPPGVTKK